MSCNNSSRKGCNFNLMSFGGYDLSRIHLDGKDRTQLNWNELSIPEILPVPDAKPDIEQLDQVYVDACISSAKLIETPYAYKTYERLASAYELTSAVDAVNLAGAVDVAPIVTAVNNILSVPLLPAIPQVTALQAALTSVTSAAASLTDAVTDGLTILGAACVPAYLVVEVMNTVNAAIGVLRQALAALVSAANALAAAVAAIPVVGPAVAAAVTALLGLVDSAVQDLLDAATALLAVITLVGTTTYFALIPNEEGTCLTGRKLIVEGVLKQKVVYTALVETQSVHSVHNEIPFTAYIIPYAKFEGLEYQENITVMADPNGDPCDTIIINGYAYDPKNPPVVDLCEEFCVNGYLEDIFANAMDCRTIFKNVTLFLLATPGTICG